MCPARYILDMIFFILIVGAVLVTVLSIEMYILEGEEDRHSECLRNIALLERELFPEWFTPSPENTRRILEEFGLTPGAVWEVENARNLAFSAVSYKRRYESTGGIPGGGSFH